MSEEEELASHLETWGPHCGAPRAVYEGHLNKLLEAVRAAAEERGAAREREADVCGVCCAQPLASGRPCICGGTGTADAERQGLRRYAFDLEHELEKSRAALERLKEWARASRALEKADEDVAAGGVQNYPRLSQAARAAFEDEQDKLTALRAAADVLMEEG